MPASVQESALIGIDIGTTSVKAVMVGADGALLDRFDASHAMVRSTSGGAEQDPAGWMALVEAALAQFVTHRASDSVAAIGITSQVNTHVFCDASLNPLRPAITWQDTRAADDATRLEGLIDADAKTAALGAPIPIDASHALSRMAWVARIQPDVWARTAHVMAPKDYVIARFTGEISADPLASIGLVGTDLRYATAILELVPQAAKLLPPLRDPLDVAGRIKAGGPFSDVPVAVGTMDAWTAMFGLGVAGEGQAMYLSGTSEVMGLISQMRAGTPGIITFPDWRGITFHAAPTQSGGASLAWLSRLLGHDVKALSQLAGKAVIGADSPLFLPHLDGERAPLWDPKSRGGFANLASTSGPEELAASVMEGVAFSARLALEALELSGRQTVAILRHGGGGATSDVWCQIRANALGRTLERVKVSDAGAQGASTMAGVACGLSGDMQSSTLSLIAIDQSFAPEREASRIADDRFEAYKALYHALSPVRTKLSRDHERAFDER